MSDKLLVLEVGHQCATDLNHGDIISVPVLYHVPVVFQLGCSRNISTVLNISRLSDERAIFSSYFLCKSVTILFSPDIIYFT